MRLCVLGLILGLALLPTPSSAGDPPAADPRNPEPTLFPTRPLLPADAWPLTLGRERAKQIALDAVEGRGTVVISSDEPVYYGGGIIMRPKDAFHTSITINWRMIQRDLAAADEGNREPDKADKRRRQP
jgi:hypothetical protein